MVLVCMGEGGGDTVIMTKMHHEGVREGGAGDGQKTAGYMGRTV